MIDRLTHMFKLHNILQPHLIATMTGLPTDDSVNFMIKLVENDPEITPLVFLHHGCDDDWNVPSIIARLKEGCFDEFYNEDEEFYVCPCCEDEIDFNRVIYNFGIKVPDNYKDKNWNRELQKLGTIKMSNVIIVGKWKFYLTIPITGWDINYAKDWDRYKSMDTYQIWAMHDEFPLPIHLGDKLENKERRIYHQDLWDMIKGFLQNGE